MSEPWADHCPCQGYEDLQQTLQECIARIECVIRRGRLPLDELGHLADIQKELETLLEQ